MARHEVFWAQKVKARWPFEEFSAALCSSPQRFRCCSSLGRGAAGHGPSQLHMGSSEGKMKSPPYTDGRPFGCGSGDVAIHTGAPGHGSSVAVRRECHV